MVDELVVSQRLKVLERRAHTPADAPGPFVDEYLAACQCDLTRIFQEFLLPLLETENSTLNVRVVDDYSFDAAIEQTARDEYRISINLGTFLAIDDFSGVSQEFYSGYSHEESLQDEVALKYRSSDSLWGDRFADYALLLDEDGGISPVIKRFGSLRNFLSNIKLLWLLYHELGHLKLGHFERFVARANSPSYHENGGYAPERGAKFSGEPDFYSAEYEADAFACYLLYAVFDGKKSQNDMKAALGAECDIGTIYLIITTVSCHMGLMLQKADVLNNKDEISRINHAPLSRVINTLVACKYVYSYQYELIEGGVVNNRRSQFNKMEKNWLYINVLCDVIPNILFLSDFMGFHVASDRLPDCDFLVKDKAFRIEMNDIKRHETAKFTLAIYHSEVLLNPFLDGEEMHLHFENWKAAVLANGKLTPSGQSAAHEPALLVSRIDMARVFLGEMWRSMKPLTSTDQYHQGEIVDRMLETVLIAKRIQNIRFELPEKS